MKKEFYILESQARLILDQLDTVKRFTNVIGKIIERKYPKFNKENIHISDNGGVKFYSILNHESETNEFQNILAKYFKEARTLKFDGELFDYLESIFGIDDIHYLIDWFNEEFGTEAEHIDGFF